MKKDVLTRPFTADQVRQRPGQHGKTLNYIEAHAVVSRLNEAADFEWSFDIVRHEVLATEVLVLGKLTIDGVTKMAFGGSTITMDASGKEVSIADDLKAAASDALKKTASLFGVALEFYGAAPATAVTTTRTVEGPRLSAENRLTSRQLAAILAAARRKGWPPNQLEAVVGEKFKKLNPQELSRGEASALLSELSGLNGH